MKAHNKFFRLNTQEKTTIHNINMLSTIINCCYAVDNLKKTSIIRHMAEILFWNECKKTLERDLALEEYSTWIAPLKLKENIGISPQSYSVLAPNNFILEWVEQNYGNSIKERLIAITNQDELNINFEVIQGSLEGAEVIEICLLYTSPSPRDKGE